MKKIINLFVPPNRWRLQVLVLMGILVGTLLNILYVSKFHSYLSDASETCMNCHIMAPQYSSWFHSSHRQFANCNECHVPHNNLIDKYWFKSKDGLRHATMFTLRLESQVIRIKESGKKVVHNNCLRCHQNIFEHREIQTLEGNFLTKEQKQRDCMDCHRQTPHGTINSLSSVPNARVPLPESAVPQWLKKLLK